jgi:hypothetical protein
MQSTPLRSRIAGLALAAAALAAVSGCEVRGELQFSPATLPDAQVGVPYAATITVTEAATPVGGAGIESGALPTGLSLDLGEAHDNTIHIHGTPTVSGSFSFTISVWCYGTNVSGQTGTQAYALVVK